MAGTQGDLGPTMAELRLQGEEAGERGSGEPEVLGVNQEVSHVASKEAELTEATCTTETQRRPQNGRRTIVSFMARTERESSKKGFGCVGCRQETRCHGRVHDGEHGRWAHRAERD